MHPFVNVLGFDGAMYNYDGYNCGGFSTLCIHVAFYHSHECRRYFAFLLGFLQLLFSGYPSLLLA